MTSTTTRTFRGVIFQFLSVYYFNAPLVSLYLGVPFLTETENGTELHYFLHATNLVSGTVRTDGSRSVRRARSFLQNRFGAAGKIALRPAGDRRNQPRRA